MLGTGEIASVGLVTIAVGQEVRCAPRQVGVNRKQLCPYSRNLKEKILLIKGLSAETRILFHTCVPIRTSSMNGATSANVPETSRRTSREHVSRVM